MRNLKTILRVFAYASAMTTLVACEEVDAPPPHAKTIAVPAPTPKVAEPVAKVETPAPAVEAPMKKEEPAKKEEVAVEEPTKPSEIIDGARDAIRKGELDRALKLAKIATLKAPNRSSAWNTLGRVQMQMGQRKDAIESFEKAVELNPKSSFAQNNLGLALVYDKRYDDAVDALEEATSLVPVEGYMWNNLGMAYEHLDRLAEARDAYQKAAELKHERAGENLARLEGVKSVFRTAKADPVKKDVPEDLPGTVEILDAATH